jgi:hypothetical protein
MNMAKFDVSKLSTNDLYTCIEELRKRGAAVAVYDADNISDGPASLDDNPDVQPSHYEAFMKENRADIEDVMCEAVWNYCQNVELVGDKLEHV